MEVAACILDEPSFKNVFFYVDGPEVRIMYPGHMLTDPEVGTKDKMFTEEDELLE